MSVNECDKLKKYINNINEIFLVLDKKGKIVDINEKGCEILGCCRKKIIGKDWFLNFLPKEIKKEIKGVFNKILKGELKEVKTYENAIVDAKGNYKLILWRNSYIKDKKGNILEVISAGKDITEERKKEIELKRQQYLFKMLFDYAPEGYFLLDFKGNFLDGNKKTEEIIGYKKENLIGKNIFKLKILPKKYFPTATKSIMLNLAGKQSGPFEYELIRKNGEKIWVEITAKPLEFIDKNVILCIARDITERKKLIAQIIQDSFVLHSTLEPVILFDENNKIIFINKALKEITGFTEQELLNKKIDEIQKVEEKNKIKKRNTIIYEGLLIKKDGGEIPVEVNQKFIKLDNKKFGLCVMHDMTHRIKQEEEIRNTIQELNQILDSTSGAICITGRDGIILKANKRFYELVEKKEDEVLGSWCGNSINIPVHDCFFKSVINGNQIKDLEQKISLSNGKEKYILINANPFKNANGEIVGVIADFKDISKIKEAEEITKKAYEKLKEADMIKTTFFSMVSHELRNPLTSIKGFLTLLDKGAAGELNSKQKEFVEILTNNTARLLNLINELLDMSKIESGTFSITKSSVNIIDTINKAVKEIMPIVSQKNITIVNNFTDKIFTVNIDEYRIIQVIVNIINNATKFSKENTKIYIDIDRVQKESINIPDYADTSKLNASDYILIKIKDEGPGIEKENLAKIFDRFYQVKETDKPIFKGLGLGLYIAKAIVDAHNGAIWVESEGKGMGATFLILLPF